MYKKNLGGEYFIVSLLLLVAVIVHGCLVVVLVNRLYLFDNCLLYVRFDLIKLYIV